MLDINKYIANDRLAGVDPEGNLAELEHWSPLIAARIAEAEGVTLEDEHWLVVFFLRQHYRDHGPAHAGTLVRELECKLFERRGRKRLYELFPRGPIAQASRIAGLPLPPGTLDPSFGSSH
jgi:tRNA 2-thiouridine synthesizing protein E